MFWWGDSRRRAWISRRLFTCSNGAASQPCLLDRLAGPMSHAARRAQYARAALQAVQPAWCHSSGWPPQAPSPQAFTLLPCSLLLRTPADTSKRQDTSASSLPSPLGGQRCQLQCHDRRSSAAKMQRAWVPAAHLLQAVEVVLHALDGHILAVLDALGLEHL